MFVCVCVFVVALVVCRYLLLFVAFVIVSELCVIVCGYVCVCGCDRLRLRVCVRACVCVDLSGCVWVCVCCLCLRGRYDVVIAARPGDCLPASCQPHRDMCTGRPPWPGPPLPHPSTILAYHLSVDTHCYRSDGTLTWRAWSYWPPGCPIACPFFLDHPQDGRTYAVTSYTDVQRIDLYTHSLQSRILTDCIIEAREVMQE